MSSSLYKHATGKRKAVSADLEALASRIHSVRAFLDLDTTSYTKIRLTAARPESNADYPTTGDIFGSCAKPVTCRWCSSTPCVMHYLGALYTVYEEPEENSPDLQRDRDEWRQMLEDATKPRAPRLARPDWLNA